MYLTSLGLGIEYNVAKNNNYKKNYELFAPEHYLSSQSPIYVQNFIRVLKMCKVESSNVWDLVYFTY